MGILEAVILGSIATWRLALMFQDEAGPGAIFEKLRMQINKLNWNEGGLRDGFYCFYCLSVWVAIFLTLLYVFIPVAFFILSVILTMSAVAIFLNYIREKYQ